jgi:hypothetical protein
MAIHLKEEDAGKIVVIQVSGKVVKADYAHFIPEFERVLRQRGKVDVLFDITNLHGWDAGAAWEDLKFDVKHFADIQKLAIVGDKKWHHGVAELFKPFTKATTRYFDHTEVPQARKWLEEASPQ